MTAISLTNYTIRVKHRRGRNFLRLDNYLEGRDFLDEIRSYLRSRESYLTDYPKQRLLLRVIRCVDHGRSISGLLEVGQYGYRTDILKAGNLDLSKVKPTYVKPIEEAVMRPFYFCLQIPPRKDLGVIALQKIGSRGIKEIFESDLQHYFGGQTSKLYIQLKQLIPWQVMEHYLDHGRLTKIRLVNFTVPSDIATRFDVGSEESDNQVELHLTAKRGGQLPYLDRVREVFAGKREVSQFLELKSIDYDNVKVEVTIGESRRTLNLRHIDQIRGNFDVTADVKFGEDGHPTFESIDAVGREIVAEAVRNVARLEDHV